MSKYPAPIKESMLTGNLLSRIWVRFFNTLSTSVETIEAKEGLDPYEAPSLNYSDIWKEMQETLVKVDGMVTQIEGLNKEIDYLKKQLSIRDTLSQLEELKKEVDYFKKQIIMEM